jgi:hypothetical protein
MPGPLRLPGVGNRGRAPRTIPELRISRCALHGREREGILERAATLSFGLTSNSDNGDDVEAKRTREPKGPDQVQAVYLEKLADELSHRGLEAWLMAPPGRVPSLYVVNPAARALEENVYVGCGKDGIWWFWWSWAERIAVADDIDLAAGTIVRVLASLRRAD